MGDLSVAMQNFNDGHGIAIVVTGMSVVFAGLTFISLFIAALPRFLSLVDRLSTPAALGSLESSDLKENSQEVSGDILGVLGFVVHSELQHLLDRQQRITINRDKRLSLWGDVGKLRSLSSRS